jgi:hypothetical protein
MGFEELFEKLVNTNETKQENKCTPYIFSKPYVPPSKEHANNPKDLMDSHYLLCICDLT